MGGNALSTPSVRLSKKEYETFYNGVVHPLLDCREVEHRLIPSYAQKESFGDMDILVHSSVPIGVIKNAVICNCAKEVVVNGPVVSAGFEVAGGVFQVDFIFVDNLNMAEFYFAFNDLGNLVGRIAHKMGFKYGHDGLKYVVRDSEHNDHVIAEITVSQDPKEIVEFLCYDYIDIETAKDKFQTLEDIFKYVTTNPRFSPDIYLLENRNHTSRVRDRKRKVYMEFLKYCEGLDSGYNWYSPDFQKKILKGVFLEDAVTSFPVFEAHLRIAEMTNEVRKKSKMKFNGEYVMQHTGLEGKQLGDFITFFKERIDMFDRDKRFDHFHHWVSVVDEDTLLYVMMKVYKDWSNKKPTS